MVMAVLNTQHGWGIVPAALLALLIGAACGVLNGIVVVKLKTEPFIMTLGTGAIFQGFVLWVSDSNTVTNVVRGLSTWTLQTKVWVIPIQFFYAIAIMLVIWWVSEHTPLGVRWLFVGKSRDVARLSGIDSDRIRFGSFVAAGVLAAFAAVVFVGNSGSMSPVSFSPFLLPAYAAVFLGATTIRPGRFNPIGTMIAVLFLATGVQGLRILGADDYTQFLFYGVTLVVAVAGSRYLRARWRLAIVEYCRMRMGGQSSLSEFVRYEQRGPDRHHHARPSEQAQRARHRDGAALGAFFGDPPAGVAAAVLTSSSEHFSAGLDLSELTETSVFDGVLHSRGWHEPLNQIQFGTIPVVSVLRGAVIGGGLELALATHIRVAEPSAYYALPEGSRGIFVGGGASVRLPRLIGVHRMADMMLTGRVIDASAGLDLGISQYLVGDGEGFDKAIATRHPDRREQPGHQLCRPPGVAPYRRDGPERRAVRRVVDGRDQPGIRPGQGAARGVPRRPCGQGRRRHRDGRRDGDDRDGDVVKVEDGDIIYEPGPDVRRNSRIGRYMDWLADERGLTFDAYAELWQWSVGDIDAFWRSIWDYFGVESSTPVGPVLGRREMPGAEWFPGTRVNYAGEYLRAAAGRDDDIAVIGVSQTRDKVTWTFGELNEQVARVRAGLVRLGVSRGDRVVALHAEPARDRRRVPRDGEPRRDVGRRSRPSSGRRRSSTASASSNRRCC